MRNTKISIHTGSSATCEVTSELSRKQALNRRPSASDIPILKINFIPPFLQRNHLNSRVPILMQKHADACGWAELRRPKISSSEATRIGGGGIVVQASAFFKECLDHDHSSQPTSAPLQPSYPMLCTLECHLPPTVFQHLTFNKQRVQTKNPKLFCINPSFLQGGQF